MNKPISPVAAVSGAITLPGDKSISHRAAMLSAVAEGASRIHNYSTGADCHSTLGCLRLLGIEVDVQGTDVVVHGRGLCGLRAPLADLDAGNSGSTIRMISGILAGQPFRSRLVGDESLSRRPMQRIMKPLAQMGARVTAVEDKFPPLEIDGGSLHAIDYVSPVASAQVKTCVLFAGLFAEGTTSVAEPTRSRDHSEIALREYGADVTVEREKVSLVGRPRLTAREFTVPSDISSAAFFICAALTIPGSDLVIRGVGLNPTRAVLLDFLVGMGAAITILDVRSEGGEVVGDIRVRHSALRGGVIEKGLTAGLIDEIPVLAVLGSATEEGITVRDASELRIKETDRIQAVVVNLRRMGVAAEELADGLVVPGRQCLRGAILPSFGDHRIAMAFAVAALRANGDSVIEEAQAASISFPEFWDTLGRITAN
jgi:3-phosphoshikimate 1-carboxyvinyltransferase